uniref:Uncharacterized protein n=1 Tax=Ciona intestinalis TaxID=7719 RepID=H2XYY7_CIOIN
CRGEIPFQYPSSLKASLNEPCPKLLAPTSNFTVLPLLNQTILGIFNSYICIVQGLEVSITRPRRIISRTERLLGTTGTARDAGIIVVLEHWPIFGFLRGCMLIDLTCYMTV